MLRTERFRLSSAVFALPIILSSSSCASRMMNRDITSVCGSLIYSFSRSSAISLADEVLLKHIPAFFLYICPVTALTRVIVRFARIAVVNASLVRNPHTNYLPSCSTIILSNSITLFSGGQGAEDPYIGENLGT